MKKPRLRTIILQGTAIIIAASVLLHANPSHAVFLNIDNAGFENPPLADGVFTNNVIPGWTGTDLRSDSFGVWNPDTTVFPGEAQEGLNVGFLERGALFQTLGEVLTANTTYSLTLFMGQHLRTSDTFYAVELLAGASVLASVSSPDPAPGMFVPVSLSYTALPSDPLLGQPLTVRIRTDDLAADGSELAFDDIKLEASRPVCSSTVTTIDGLRAEVEMLNTSTQTINNLTAILDKVQEALDTGNNETARTRIRNFIDKVINRSNLKETNSHRIPLSEANNLICSAANVLSGIPLP